MGSSNYSYLTGIIIYLHRALWFLVFLLNRNKQYVEGIENRKKAYLIGVALSFPDRGHR